MADRKLTDKDISQIAAMRKSGASFQEIGDKFGVSKQWIGILLHGTGRVHCKPQNTHQIIYPKIRKYLEDNRMSVHRFAVFCKLCSQTTWNGITGQCNMSKKTIDKILSATGMTYEEAFGIPESK